MPLARAHLEGPILQRNIMVYAFSLLGSLDEMLQVGTHPPKATLSLCLSVCCVLGLFFFLCFMYHPT